MALRAVAAAEQERRFVARHAPEVQVMLRYPPRGEGCELGLDVAMGVDVANTIDTASIPLTPLGVLGSTSSVDEGLASASAPEPQDASAGPSSEDAFERTTSTPQQRAMIAALAARATPEVLERFEARTADVDDGSPATAASQFPGGVGGIQWSHYPNESWLGQAQAYLADIEERIGVLGPQSPQYSGQFAMGGPAWPIDAWRAEKERAQLLAAVADLIAAGRAGASADMLAAVAAPLIERHPVRLLQDDLRRSYGDDAYVAQSAAHLRLREALALRRMLPELASSIAVDSVSGYAASLVQFLESSGRQAGTTFEVYPYYEDHPQTASEYANAIDPWRYDGGLDVPVVAWNQGRSLAERLYASGIERVVVANVGDGSEWDAIRAQPEFDLTTEAGRILAAERWVQLDQPEREIFWRLEPRMADGTLDVAHAEGADPWAAYRRIDQRLLANVPPADFTPELTPERMASLEARQRRMDLQVARAQGLQLPDDASHEDIAIASVSKSLAGQVLPWDATPDQAAAEMARFPLTRDGLVLRTAAMLLEGRYSPARGRKLPPEVTDLAALSRWLTEEVAEAAQAVATLPAVAYDDTPRPLYTNYLPAPSPAPRQALTAALLDDVGQLDDRFRALILSGADVAALDHEFQATLARATQQIDAHLSAEVDREIARASADAEAQAAAFRAALDAYEADLPKVREAWVARIDQLAPEHQALAREAIPTFDDMLAEVASLRAFFAADLVRGRSELEASVRRMSADDRTVLLGDVMRRMVEAMEAASELYAAVRPEVTAPEPGQEHSPFWTHRARTGQAAEYWPERPAPTVDDPDAVDPVTGEPGMTPAITAGPSALTVLPDAAAAAVIDPRYPFGVDLQTDRVTGDPEDVNAKRRFKLQSTAYTVQFPALAEQAVVGVESTVRGAFDALDQAKGVVAQTLHTRLGAYDVAMSRLLDEFEAVAPAEVTLARDLTPLSRQIADESDALRAAIARLRGILPQGQLDHATEALGEAIGHLETLESLASLTDIPPLVDLARELAPLGAVLEQMTSRLQVPASLTVRLPALDDVPTVDVADIAGPEALLAREGIAAPSETSIDLNRAVAMVYLHRAGLDPGRTVTVDEARALALLAKYGLPTDEPMRRADAWNIALFAQYAPALGAPARGMPTEEAIARVLLSREGLEPGLDAPALDRSLARIVLARAGATDDGTVGYEAARVRAYLNLAGAETGGTPTLSEAMMRALSTQRAALIAVDAQLGGVLPDTVRRLEQADEPWATTSVPLARLRRPLGASADAIAPGAPSFDAALAEVAATARRASDDFARRVALVLPSLAESMVALGRHEPDWPAEPYLESYRAVMEQSARLAMDAVTSSAMGLVPGALVRARDELDQRLVELQQGPTLRRAIDAMAKVIRDYEAALQPDARPTAGSALRGAVTELSSVEGSATVDIPTDALSQFLAIVPADGGDALTRMLRVYKSAVDEYNALMGGPGGVAAFVAEARQTVGRALEASTHQTDEAIGDYGRALNGLVEATRATAEDLYREVGGDVGFRPLRYDPSTGFWGEIVDRAGQRDAILAASEGGESNPLAAASELSFGKLNEFQVKVLSGHMTEIRQVLKSIPKPPGFDAMKRSGLRPDQETWSLPDWVQTTSRRGRLGSTDYLNGKSADYYFEFRGVDAGTGGIEGLNDELYRVQNLASTISDRLHYDADPSDAGPGVFLGLRTRVNNGQVVDRTDSVGPLVVEREGNYWQFNGMLVPEKSEDRLRLAAAMDVFFGMDTTSPGMDWRSIVVPNVLVSRLDPSETIRWLIAHPNVGRVTPLAPPPPPPPLAAPASVAPTPHAGVAPVQIAWGSSGGGGASRSTVDVSYAFGRTVPEAERPARPTRPVVEIAIPRTASGWVLTSNGSPLTLSADENKYLQDVMNKIVAILGGTLAPGDIPQLAFDIAGAEANFTTADLIALLNGVAATLIPDLRSGGAPTYDTKLTNALEAEHDAPHTDVLAEVAQLTESLEAATEAADEAREDALDAQIIDALMAQRAAMRAAMGLADDGARAGSIAAAQELRGAAADDLARSADDLRRRAGEQPALLPPSDREMTEAEVAQLLAYHEHWRSEAATVEAIQRINAGEDVAGAQRALAALGLYQGPIDGRMGPQTRAALEAFRELDQGGSAEIDREELGRLQGADLERRLLADAAYLARQVELGRTSYGVEGSRMVRGLGRMRADELEQDLASGELAKLVYGLGGRDNAERLFGAPLRNGDGSLNGDFVAGLAEHIEVLQANHTAAQRALDQQSRHAQAQALMAEARDGVTRGDLLQRLNRIFTDPIGASVDNFRDGVAAVWKYAIQPALTVGYDGTRYLLEGGWSAALRDGEARNFAFEDAIWGTGEYKTPTPSSVDGPQADSLGAAIFHQVVASVRGFKATLGNFNPHWAKQTAYRDSILESLEEYRVRVATEPGPHLAPPLSDLDFHTAEMHGTLAGFLSVIDTAATVLSGGLVELAAARGLQGLKLGLGSLVARLSAEAGESAGRTFAREAVTTAAEVVSKNALKDARTVVLGELRQLGGDRLAAFAGHEWTSEGIDLLTDVVDIFGESIIDREAPPSVNDIIASLVASQVTTGAITRTLAFGASRLSPRATLSGMDVDRVSQAVARHDVVVQALERADLGAGDRARFDAEKSALEDYLRVELRDLSRSSGSASPGASELADPKTTIRAGVAAMYYSTQRAARAEDASLGALRDYAEASALFEQLTRSPAAAAPRRNAAEVVRSLTASLGPSFTALRAQVVTGAPPAALDALVAHLDAAGPLDAATRAQIVADLGQVARARGDLEAMRAQYLGLARQLDGSPQDAVLAARADAAWAMLAARLGAPGGPRPRKLSQLGAVAAFLTGAFESPTVQRSVVEAVGPVGDRDVLSALAAVVGVSSETMVDAYTDPSAAVPLLDRLYDLGFVGSPRRFESAADALSALNAGAVTDGHALSPGAYLVMGPQGAVAAVDTRGGPLTELPGVSTAPVVVLAISDTPLVRDLAALAAAGQTHAFGQGIEGGDDFPLAAIPGAAGGGAAPLGDDSPADSLADVRDASGTLRPSDGRVLVPRVPGYDTSDTGYLAGMGRAIDAATATLADGAATVETVRRAAGEIAAARRALAAGDEAQADFGRPTRESAPLTYVIDKLSREGRYAALVDRATRWAAAHQGTRGNYVSLVAADGKPFDVPLSRINGEGDSYWVTHPSARVVGPMTDYVFQTIADVMADDQVSPTDALARLADAHFVAMQASVYLRGTPSIITSLVQSTLRAKFGLELGPPRSGVEPFWEAILGPRDAAPPLVGEALRGWYVGNFHNFFENAATTEVMRRSGDLDALVANSALSTSAKERLTALVNAPVPKVRMELDAPSLDLSQASLLPSGAIVIGDRRVGVLVQDTDGTPRRYAPELPAQVSAAEVGRSRAFADYRAVVADAITAGDRELVTGDVWQAFESSVAATGWGEGLLATIDDDARIALRDRLRQAYPDDLQDTTLRTILAPLWAWETVVGVTPEHAVQIQEARADYLEVLGEVAQAPGADPRQLAATLEAAEQRFFVFADLAAVTDTFMLDARALVRRAYGPAARAVIARTANADVRAGYVVQAAELDCGVVVAERLAASLQRMFGAAPDGARGLPSELRDRYRALADSSHPSPRNPGGPRSQGLWADELAALFRESIAAAGVSGAHVTTLDRQEFLEGARNNVEHVVTIARATRLPQALMIEIPAADGTFAAHWVDVIGGRVNGDAPVAFVRDPMLGDRVLSVPLDRLAEMATGEAVVTTLTGVDERALAASLSRGETIAARDIDLALRPQRRAVALPEARLDNVRSYVAAVDRVPREHDLLALAPIERVNSDLARLESELTLATGQYQLALQLIQRSTEVDAAETTNLRWAALRAIRGAIEHSRTLSGLDNGTPLPFDPRRAAYAVVQARILTLLALDEAPRSAGRREAMDLARDELRTTLAAMAAVPNTASDSTRMLLAGAAPWAEQAEQWLTLLDDARSATPILDETGLRTAAAGLIGRDLQSPDDRFGLGRFVDWHLLGDFGSAGMALPGRAGAGIRIASNVASLVPVTADGATPTVGAGGSEALLVRAAPELRSSALASGPMSGVMDGAIARAVSALNGEGTATARVRTALQAIQAGWQRQAHDPANDATIAYLHGSPLPAVDEAVTDYGAVDVLVAAPDDSYLARAHDRYWDDFAAEDSIRVDVFGDGVGAGKVMPLVTGAVIGAPTDPNRHVELRHPAPLSASIMHAYAQRLVAEVVSDPVVPGREAVTLDGDLRQLARAYFIDVHASPYAAGTGPIILSLIQSTLMAKYGVQLGVPRSGVNIELEALFGPKGPPRLSGERLQSWFLDNFTYFFETANNTAAMRQGPELASVVARSATDDAGVRPDVAADLERRLRAPRPDVWIAWSNGPQPLDNARVGRDGRLRIGEAIVGQLVEDAQGRVRDLTLGATHASFGGTGDANFQEVTRLYGDGARVERPNDSTLAAAYRVQGDQANTCGVEVANFAMAQAQVLRGETTSLGLTEDLAGEYASLASSPSRGGLGLSRADVGNLLGAALGAISGLDVRVETAAPVRSPSLTASAASIAESAASRRIVDLVNLARDTGIAQALLIVDPDDSAAARPPHWVNVVGGYLSPLAEDLADGGGVDPNRSTIYVRDPLVGDRIVAVPLGNLAKLTNGEAVTVQRGAPADPAPVRPDAVAAAYGSPTYFDQSERVIAEGAALGVPLPGNESIAELFSAASNAYYRGVHALRISKTTSGRDAQAARRLAAESAVTALAELHRLRELDGADEVYPGNSEIEYMANLLNIRAVMEASAHGDFGSSGPATWRAAEVALDRLWLPPSSRADFEMAFHEMAFATLEPPSPAALSGLGDLAELVMTSVAIQVDALTDWWVTRRRGLLGGGIDRAPSAGDTPGASAITQILDRTWSDAVLASRWQRDLRVTFDEIALRLDPSTVSPISDAQARQILEDALRQARRSRTPLASLAIEARVYRQIRQLVALTNSDDFDVGDVLGTARRVLSVDYAGDLHSPGQVTARLNEVASGMEAALYVARRAEARSDDVAKPAFVIEGDLDGLMDGRQWPIVEELLAQTMWSLGKANPSEPRLTIRRSADGIDIDFAGRPAFASHPPLTEALKVDAAKSGIIIVGPSWDEKGAHMSLKFRTAQDSGTLRSWFDDAPWRRTSLAGISIPDSVPAAWVDGINRALATGRLELVVAAEAGARLAIDVDGVVRDGAGVVIGSLRQSSQEAAGLVEGLEATSGAENLRGALGLSEDASFADVVERYDELVGSTSPVLSGSAKDALEVAFERARQLELNSMAGRTVVTTAAHRQLDRVDLTGSRLVGPDGPAFSGFSRNSPVIISHSALVGANFAGAMLEWAWIDSSNLDDANFTGASLVGAVLRDVQLTNDPDGRLELNDVRLTTNFEGADLRSARFESVILRGVDLSDWGVSGATTFFDSDLRGAKLPDGLSIDSIVFSRIDGTTVLPASISLARLANRLVELSRSQDRVLRSQAQRLLDAARMGSARDPWRVALVDAAARIAGGSAARSGDYRLLRVPTSPEQRAQRDVFSELRVKHPDVVDEITRGVRGGMYQRGSRIDLDVRLSAGDMMLLTRELGIEFAVLFKLPTNPDAGEVTTDLADRVRYSLLVGGDKSVGPFPVGWNILAHTHPSGPVNMPNATPSARDIRLNDMLIYGDDGSVASTSGARTLDGVQELLRGSLSAPSLRSPFEVRHDVRGIVLADTLPDTWMTALTERVAAGDLALSVMEHVGVATMLPTGELLDDRDQVVGHLVDRNGTRVQLGPIALGLDAVSDAADARRLLGVRDGESAALIKQRYRELARLLHPDQNPDRDRGDFAALSAAYELLTGNSASAPTSTQPSGPGAPSSGPGTPLDDMFGTVPPRASVTALRGELVDTSKTTYWNYSGKDMTRAVLREGNSRPAFQTRRDTGAPPVFNETNLTEADLAHANLANARLSRAVMTGTILAGANLSRAQLYSLDLTAAVLTGATLTSATFTRVNLNGVDLSSTVVKGSPMFPDSDLRGATLPVGVSAAGLALAQLDGSSVLPAGVTYADIAAVLAARRSSSEAVTRARAQARVQEARALADGDPWKQAVVAAIGTTSPGTANPAPVSRPRGAGITSSNGFDTSTARKPWNFSRASFDGVDFSGGPGVPAFTQRPIGVGPPHFNDVGLENARFVGADLSDAQFLAASMRGANLKDADLTGAWLRGGTDLRGVIWEAATLTDTRFAVDTDLRGASMAKAVAGSTTTIEGDARGAKLPNGLQAARVALGRYDGATTFGTLGRAEVAAALVRALDARDAKIRALAEKRVAETLALPGADTWRQLVQATLRRAPPARPAPTWAGALPPRTTPTEAERAEPPRRQRVPLSDAHRVQLEGFAQSLAGHVQRRRMTTAQADVVWNYLVDLAMRVDGGPRDPANTGNLRDLFDETLARTGNVVSAFSQVVADSHKVVPLDGAMRLSPAFIKVSDAADGGLVRKYQTVRELREAFGGSEVNLMLIAHTAVAFADPTTRGALEALIRLGEPAITDEALATRVASETLAGQHLASSAFVMGAASGWALDLGTLAAEAGVVDPEVVEAAAAFAEVAGRFDPEWFAPIFMGGETPPPEFDAWLAEYRARYRDLPSALKVQLRFDTMTNFGPGTVASGKWTRLGIAFANPPLSVNDVPSLSAAIARVANQYQREWTLLHGGSPAAFRAAVPELAALGVVVDGGVFVSNPAAITEEGRRTMERQLADMLPAAFSEAAVASGSWVKAAGASDSTSLLDPEDTAREIARVASDVLRRWQGHAPDARPDSTAMLAGLAQLGIESSGDGVAFDSDHLGADARARLVAQANDALNARAATVNSPGRVVKASEAIANGTNAARPLAGDAAGLFGVVLPTATITAQRLQLASEESVLPPEVAAWFRDDLPLLGAALSPEAFAAARRVETVAGLRTDLERVLAGRAADERSRAVDALARWLRNVEVLSGVNGVTPALLIDRLSQRPEQVRFFAGP